MRPTDQLRDLAGEDWIAATTHPFCTELANGTLPLDKMRWYLAQDYQFVGNFVRLLASAIAHAPTLADSVPAAQFLAVVTGPENTYFLRSFEALGMDAAAQTPPPAAPTEGFNALMAEAAASGRYELMLAVLVVAEWVYLSWATPVNPPKEDLPFYFAEWITLHAGEGFEGVVAYLRGQLDAVWLDLSETARSEVEAMFLRTAKLEREFWDAAYAS